MKQRGLGFESQTLSLQGLLGATTSLRWAGAGSDGSNLQQANSRLREHESNKQSFTYTYTHTYTSHVSSLLTSCNLDRRICYHTNTPRSITLSSIMHRTYSMRQSRAPTASQIQNPPPPSSSTKSGRFFGKGGVGECFPSKSLVRTTTICHLFFLDRRLVKLRSMSLAGPDLNEGLLSQEISLRKLASSRFDAENYASAGFSYSHHGETV